MNHQSLFSCFLYRISLTPRQRWWSLVLIYEWCSHRPICGLSVPSNRPYWRSLISTRRLSYNKKLLVGSMNDLSYRTSRKLCIQKDYSPWKLAARFLCPFCSKTPNPPINPTLHHALPRQRRPIVTLAFIQDLILVYFPLGWPPPPLQPPAPSSPEEPMELSAILMLIVLSVGRWFL